MLSALRVGQVAVVAAAAAAAHSAFLAVNWGVVKGWSLAGHDDADSYIMEGSAFNENAHVAQGARWPCLTACACARANTLPVSRSDCARLSEIGDS